MSKLSSAMAGVPSAKQPGAKADGKRGFKGFRKVRGGHWFHLEYGRAAADFLPLTANPTADGWRFKSYWMKP